MKTRARSETSRGEPIPSGATVLEVAAVAGVSPSTVSRILNGTARVSEEKRQAVERAIEELNFKPNLLAQSLKRGNSMTVGVLTQAVDSPFFNESLKGIEDGLAGTGYAPLIVSGHWNAKEEAERVGLLMARRVDGIIILTGHMTDEDIILFSHHVPIVATGHVFEAAERASAIRLNNEMGGYMATHHLLELGHRTIAHIAGIADHPDAVERLAGYRRALDEAGIPFDPDLVVQGDFRESGGVVGIAQLLERSRLFTAIFAANDQTAYGARLALYRKGIRVPEDVSLIGFDDLPASVYTTPPLTTVRQPVYEIGRMAARVLLDLIAGRPGSLQLPQLELVIRETTMRLR
ncbi:substrate-binding domain-containing protein [Niveibacterium sp. SC-1]|uniref:LacI family DNA-binding transcriptional regulator n=1 Tax=Niveibacterium sp. SC-1 TaxID=3135646 RepID=UPI00311FE8AC